MANVEIAFGRHVFAPFARRTAAMVTVGMFQKSDRIVLWLIAGVAVLFTALAVKKVFEVSTQTPVSSVMDLTQFAKPEQIGAVLYRRFWLELRDHSTVVLGGIDPDSQRVWTGFREVAQASGVDYSPDPAAQHFFSVVPSSPAELKEARQKRPNAFLIFETWLPLTQAERTGAKLTCEKSQFACLSLVAADQGRLRKHDPKQWTAVVLRLDRDPNVILLFVHGPTK